MSVQLQRGLHPLAWWGWALGLAVAAGLTTNPLLLLLLVIVVWQVVDARRTDSPWSRAFRLYVYLALIIVAVRIVLHVLVGFKFGKILVLPLPGIDLPDWAAGVGLLGNVYLEGLLDTAAIGLKLGVLIIAIGGANALANPKRLLRSLPTALNEVGTAVVVSISVAPQLAESVQRVLRARLLRGDNSRGLRAVPRVALPVLQDTLDRSLLLASSMEARGYGRRTRQGSGVLVGFLTLGGLLLLTIGMYGVLDATRGLGVLGVPAIVAGAVVVAVGLFLGGRSVRVTRYRPDPWRWPETVTVLSGVAAAAGVIWVGAHDPAALLLQTQPLAPPDFPVVAVAGILVALLPAFVTPVPEAVVR